MMKQKDLYIITDIDVEAFLRNMRQALNPPEVSEEELRANVLANIGKIATYTSINFDDCPRIELPVPIKYSSSVHRYRAPAYMFTLQPAFTV